MTTTTTYQLALFYQKFKDDGSYLEYTASAFTIADQSFGKYYNDLAYSTFTGTVSDTAYVK